MLGFRTQPGAPTIGSVEQTTRPGRASKQLLLACLDLHLPGIGTCQHRRPKKNPVTFLSSRRLQHFTPAMSRFAKLADQAPDAAFALIEEFKEDSSTVKVDLSPGFYRDEDARPWVLPSVQMVATIAAPGIVHFALTASGQTSPARQFFQQSRTRASTRAF